jgi:hypothetical protein
VLCALATSLALGARNQPLTVGQSKVGAKVKFAFASTTPCLKAVFETDNGAGLADIFAAPGVSA